MVACIAIESQFLYKIFNVIKLGKVEMTIVINVLICNPHYFEDSPGSEVCASKLDPVLALFTKHFCAGNIGIETHSTKIFRETFTKQKMLIKQPSATFHEKQFECTRQSIKLAGYHYNSLWFVLANGLSHECMNVFIFIFFLIAALIMFV